MTTSNLFIPNIKIRYIEKLNNSIHNDLLSYTTDNQNIYQEMFQRLYNASSTLYINAIRFCNGLSFTPELIKTNITADDIENILRHLHNLITDNKFPKEIFDEFFSLLKSYNICPNFILKTNKEEMNKNYYNVCETNGE